MASLYEKQMQWRKASASKAQQSTTRDATNCTFTPTFYTQQSTVKSFEGPARELTESASKVFVERNARARKEKQQMEDKLYGRNKKPTAIPITAPSSSSSSTGNAYTGISSSNEHAEKSASPTAVQTAASEFDSPMSEKQLRDTMHKYAPNDGAAGDSSDLNAMDELSVVDMLERERRQWHAERIKLIHCIHLQQLELAASSSAAQSRASEIAKEFARTIEGFEERLVHMESSVQKELMAIKAVASELVKSSGAK